MVHRLGVLLIAGVVTGCATHPYPPLLSGEAKEWRDEQTRSQAISRYLGHSQQDTAFSQRVGANDSAAGQHDYPRIAPYWFPEDASLRVREAMRLEDAIQMVALSIGYSPQYRGAGLQDIRLPTDFSGPLLGPTGFFQWLNYGTRVRARLLPESRLVVISHEGAR